MGNQLTTLPTVISKLILSEIDVRENRIQDLTPLEGIQTLKKVISFFFFFFLKSYFSFIFIDFIRYFRSLLKETVFLLIQFLLIILL